MRLTDQPSEMAEQERIDAASSYKMVLDTIFCNILIFDAQGTFIFYNHTAEGTFRGIDIDLEEMLDTGFSVFTDAVSEKTDPLKGKGRYVLVLNGHDFICNVQPLLFEEKRMGTAYILHESLHPNCIMQELDVTTSLLQEINIFVESSHDGFMVTTSQGEIIRVNEAFEKAFSLPRRSVVGRNIADLLSDGTFSDSAALRVIKTKKPATGMLTKGEQTIISTGTPVFDNCGHFTSVVVNLRDITELNDLRNRLEYQQMVAEGYVRELAYISNKNGDQMIIHSRKMQQIMDTIKAISQIDSTILITGESGTGKEVVANRICQLSNRQDKPFIKINCGAIPASLFESELFGYEEGAFTGAKRKGKAGFFELANGGTLFMDEIGELDLNLQVKLLRVLQEGEVTRIGGAHAIQVDVRVIVATNRDLWQMVEEGLFRQDLFYRLNVINIEVPPLRDRRDDIIPLAISFLEKYNQKYDKKKKLSMALGKILMSLDWPGNIRELENIIQNMVVLAQDDLLEPGDLPVRYRQSDEPEGDTQVVVSGIMPLKEAVNEAERQLLKNAREKYTTTREMARALGVDQSTISRKMEKLFPDNQ